MILSLKSQNWHGFATLRNGIPLEWYIELSGKPEVDPFQELFVKSKDKDSGWIKGAVWRDGTQSPLRDLLFLSSLVQSLRLAPSPDFASLTAATFPLTPGLGFFYQIQFSGSEPPLWLLGDRVFDLGLSWCKWLMLPKAKLVLLQVQWGTVLKHSSLHGH